MLWSILICGVPERYHLIQPLLYSLLETQAVGRMSDIELLYLLDNKRRTVGAKRNALLAAANGEFISFIDDDDMVAPDYVKRIHDAMLQAKRSDMAPDVLCFGQRATLHPHGIVHECSYSLKHWKERPADSRRQLAPAPGPDGKPLPNVLLWSGPPAHTMVWRRSAIGDARFPEQQFGEDVAWVDAVCERATSEMQLGGDPLYFYQFDQERSLTR
jgi:glycosyltransferase involved in cell wall biosynthesis